MAAPLTEQTPAAASDDVEVAAISSDPGGRPTVRQIFEEHARYVWRTLRHLGVADADLEDVCQEVFVTVHRKLPEFEGRSKLRTWLYGICLRVASDYRRKAYIRRERAVADPLQGTCDVRGNQPDMRVELRATLVQLLDALDEDKRAVLVLYEIEGLSMKEVAEVVGCPLQTAYSRLHAARRRIAEVVSRENGETFPSDTPDTSEEAAG